MLAIIAAVGANYEMGQDNQVPWGKALPADIAWLRRHIAGKVVVAGRKTYEQMQSMLSSQAVYVVSRHSPSEKPDNVHYVSDVAELAPLQSGEDEAMVLGGAQINKLLLPYCARLYLTEVQQEFSDADVFFPEFNTDDFTVSFKEAHAADQDNKYGFEFKIYERQRGLRRLR